MKLKSLLLIVLVLLLVAACGSNNTDSGDAPYQLPELITKGDSLAMMALESAGGLDALTAVRGLRFDFAFERMGARQRGRSHLWDRQTGDYRIEYRQGDDSSYVVLFNINSREGDVYLNGVEADSADQVDRLAAAYHSFINDSYWLLAPTKMLDPGVTRTYLEDSSDANIQVVNLSFEGVGITPGDQYWMYLNAETGQLMRWSFVLERNPDAAPRVYNWLDYDRFDTPAGPVRFASRKNIDGQPASILTDKIEIMDDMPEWFMTDPTARLVP